MDKRTSSWNAEWADGTLSLGNGRVTYGLGLVGEKGVLSCLSLSDHAASGERLVS